MVAARRAVGKSGSLGSAMILGMDASGKHLRTWELKLRSATLVSFRKWQRFRHMTLTKNSGYKSGLRVGLTRVRTDATNIALWREHHINATEVTCAFNIVPIMPSTTYTNLEAITESKKY